MNPKILALFIIMTVFLVVVTITVFPGRVRTTVNTVVTVETITYTIPEEKRAEAAALYQEVFKAAIKEDSFVTRASDAAQRAVERIYGYKEVSRRTETPEKIRK